jgi:Ca2+-transporting ATPase
MLGHLQDDLRRAFVFSTLVVANLCLILTNRSWTRTILSMFKEPNPALWWIIGGALAVLALVLNVPVLSKQFHFKALSLIDYLLCLGAGILGIFWFEILKVLRMAKKQG